MTPTWQHIGDSLGSHGDGGELFASQIHQYVAQNHR